MRLQLNRYTCFPPLKPSLLAFHLILGSCQLNYPPIHEKTIRTLLVKRGWESVEIRGEVGGLGWKFHLVSIQSTLARTHRDTHTHTCLWGLRSSHSRGVDRNDAHLTDQTDIRLKIRGYSRVHRLLCQVRPIIMSLFDHIYSQWKIIVY